MLQTKYGILQSKYGAQNLNQTDQCTAEQDAAQLGNNRCKITLRHAARTSHTGTSKGGESTVAVQANVEQLAVYARKTALAIRSTVINALANVPTRQRVQRIRRLQSSSEQVDDEMQE
jgi:hypothetical protein